ncbi:MAG: prepilin-type N-terminal cleavage/methylation domain-containing protein [Verrucomicrobiae bacterium]|nr:prepilin-type N-terminal cleavage/methylation domain-containing protein [Verrucomicrobiae bacterium]
MKTNMRFAVEYDRNTAFTLIEVLVVIGIIGIIAGMLLPALSRAKETSRRTGCLSNLRQVYLAVAAFAEDNDDRLPFKYEVKKSSLKQEDVTNGKRLQTLSDGIHTVLAPYLGSTSNIAAATPLKVFKCPSDKGSYDNTTSVFERKGTSYQVEGVDLKKESTDPQRNRFSFSSKRKIAWDVFKPWDSDDIKKVQQQVAKGELGAVKWHAYSFNMVFGDGRVVSIRSKAQEKAEQGENSED